MAAVRPAQPEPRMTVSRVSLWVVIVFSDIAVWFDCNWGKLDSFERVGTRIVGMANLTLVYGMRLLPADEVASVGDAPIQLKNGNQAQVAMHVLEGSRETIEAQLKLSLDAF